MAKRGRRKSKTTTYEVPPEQVVGMTKLSKRLSDKEWRQTKALLVLVAQGHKVTTVAEKLGISRATAYRRMKIAKATNSANPQKPSDAVYARVGQLLSELEEQSRMAMRLGGFDKEILTGEFPPDVTPPMRMQALYMAMRAAEQRLRVMQLTGVFRAIALQNEIKSGRAAKEYVSEQQQQVNMALLDENQNLRDNLEAARRGEPEPYPDSQLVDWEEWMGSFKQQSHENSETLSGFNFSNN